MAPERIVIIDDMSTARGGATALALLSARLFAAQGFDVTYVTGDGGNNPELAELGITVLATGRGRLLELPKLKALATGIYDPKIVQLLGQLIAQKDSPQTIYHLHGWAQTLSPSVLKPLQAVADRCFVHCHDLSLACPNSVFFNFRTAQDCNLEPLSGACIRTHCDKRSYIQKLWRVARQKVLRQLFDQKIHWAGIVMIHPKMQDWLTLANYPPARLLSVRNPTQAFSNTRITAENNNRFAFVGRVEPDKGVLDFVKAGQAANVPLTIIGDGPLRAELQQKHPDIHFSGWVSPDQIGGHLQDCRALVMPSRFREPFGLVAVEASLSGLPLIVGNNAFLADEVLASGLGYACDVRNPVALQAAMEKMRDTTKPTLHEISIKGASGSAKLSQTPDQWAAQLIDLYDRALTLSAGA